MLSAAERLCERPAELGRQAGFTALTDELHGTWIRDMLRDGADMTLQAHRGSYKTTCAAVAMAVTMLLRPGMRIAFVRKTDDDAREVVATVRKLLEHPFTRVLAERIWDRPLTLVRATTLELTTSLAAAPDGCAQLTGLGLGGSITGRHFERIFTDDIVNMQDRVSKAERERTKLIYQELQNIKNRGGRIVNTGTPWHPEDAFSVMPPPVTWNCYDTGLISREELERLRGTMLPSLFAVNYELRHIPAESVLFPHPRTGADPSLAEGGLCHLDAAYGGSDSTAFTVLRRRNDTVYVYGRLWQQHAEEVIDEIAALQRRFLAGPVRCESNADKGYLARRLRERGVRTVSYHESMNKFVKIATFLKGAWERIVFTEGTDESYIRQITDFCEDAAHDDAPDSLACALRALGGREQGSRRLPALFKGGIP